MRNILFLISLIIFSIGCFSTHIPVVNQSEDSCTLLPQVEKLVIPHFKKEINLHPYKCKVLSSEQLKEYSKLMMKRELNPNKLKYEEYIFKKLGILNSSDSYIEELDNFYQAVSTGFYDSKLKTLVILDNLSSEETLNTLVHEMVHIAQDSLYDLTKLRNQQLSSDELMARAAVIEGQAIVIENEVKKTAEYETILKSIKKTAQNKNYYEGYKHKHGILKKLLQFSYVHGPTFVSKSKDEEDIFHNLPRSTHEVLFKSKYQDKNLISKSNHLFQDRLGAYFLELLLEKFVDFKKAKKLAKSWVDDRITLKKENGNYKIKWEILFSEPSATNEVKSIFSKKIAKSKGYKIIKKNNMLILTTAHISSLS